MQFRNLFIGQTFDWVNDAVRYNSFFKRCTKVSNTTYRDEDDVLHSVGTVRAEVYHVGPDLPAEAIDPADYISCVVKGNLTEATVAAERHGIPFVFRNFTQHGETVGNVPARFLLKVMSWFGESGSAPFPVGTCLVFSHHKGEDAPERRSGHFEYGPAQIDDFKSKWPAHGLPDDLVCVQAEFGSQGDLDGVECFDLDGMKLDDTAFDGPALLAMVNDIQQFGSPARPVAGLNDDWEPEDRVVGVEAMAEGIIAGWEEEEAAANVAFREQVDAEMAKAEATVDRGLTLWEAMTLPKEERTKIGRALAAGGLVFRS